MRLQNVKILFCWPPRLCFYCFVGIAHFLEQFVSMGVLGHFSLCLYLCTMHLLLIRYLAMKHEIPASSEADVCFSKQHAQSEDGDGDFMRTSGP